MLSVALFPPAGRDPRAMDARGPVQAQRVPMAAGMPGPVPHGMGSNAPPPARPVKWLQLMFSTFLSVLCFPSSCWPHTSEDFQVLTDFFFFKRGRPQMSGQFQQMMILLWQFHRHRISQILA